MKILHIISSLETGGAQRLLSDILPLMVKGNAVTLLVNKDNMKMPNMSGWSRKEVTAFWELTGIQVTLDGSGYVTSQSVAVGESINQNTPITVKLE